MDDHNLAIEEQGRGSVTQQKAVFHNFIDSYKHNVFSSGVEVLMVQLLTAAKTVRRALNNHFKNLQKSHCEGLNNQAAWTQRTTLCFLSRVNFDKIVILLIYVVMVVLCKAVLKIVVY
ncbi:hypothetical protein EDD22DRAFT_849871 [Suillus occidentalis]|nr:hypothetical protein EDD22DRAFT_849871 [Suillus occidentalis]